MNSWLVHLLGKPLAADFSNIEPAHVPTHYEISEVVWFTLCLFLVMVVYKKFLKIPVRW